MTTPTQRRTGGAILIAFTGVIAAVVVFVLTADAVRTIIPLLVAVAAVRWLLHRGAASR